MKQWENDEKKGEITIHYGNIRKTMRNNENGDEGMAKCYITCWGQSFVLGDKGAKKDAKGR